MPDPEVPPASPLSPDQPTFVSLDARLHSLKSEIDDVQKYLRDSKTPWYRNASTLIAFLALAFSFGTTVVSYQRAHQQDVQAARAELRGFIQRLAELPKENLQLSRTYADDQMALGNLQSFITQESTLVAKQAAEVIRRIPDQVSATEYSAVAYALWSNGANAQAMDFVRRAADKATDVNDEAAVLRQYGGYLMASGQPNEARVQYQKALAVFSKYSGYPEGYRNSMDAYTEFHWAQSEAGAGNIDQMQTHLATAENLASRLGPAGRGLQQQLAQMRAWVTGGAAPGAGTANPAETPAGVFPSGPMLQASPSSQPAPSLPPVAQPAPSPTE